MKRLLLTSALLCASASAFAQQWSAAQVSVGQVALDYERSPSLADQKYRNVQLVIARAAVFGAPGTFPSGRSYLPIMGLGTDGPPVRAILPTGEIPPGIGRGAEVSMTCTAQGYYTPEGRAVQSPDQGLLVLACGALRVLR